MKTLQVVVFAGCAQAFLGIGDTKGFGWFDAQKIVLKLSHPGVVEHQGRIVFGNDRRTLNDEMLAFLEEFEELTAYFARSFHAGKPFIFLTLHGG